MQFEVLATCHTTRARVSRMKLARRSFNRTIVRVFAAEAFQICRWGYLVAHVHASSYAGGYQGSDLATDGVTRGHPDPQ